MIRIIIFAFLFTACSTNPKEKSEIKTDKPIEAVASNDETSHSDIESIDDKLSKQSIEVLDIDSIWLNDAIQFSSTQLEVREKLGKPDSITTPNFECGAYIAGEEPWGDTVNIWHFQGTQIVVFKDKAELMIVRLKEWDCTFHHPRIIFSGYTSLEDLAEVFPKSVASSYDWEDVRNGLTYKLVRIAPKENWDDQWVLKFINNQLVEIEYWTPC